MNNSVLLLLLLLTGGGGAYLYHEHSSPEHMALVEANKKLKESQAEAQRERVDKEKFMRWIDSMEATHGLAQVVVTDVVPPTDENKLGSETLLFTEVDATGKVVGEPVPFYIEGKLARFEAQVLEFKRKKEGEPDQSHSVALFTHLWKQYGDTKVLHAEDIPIQVGVPASEAGAAAVTKEQQEMWSKQFWKYAHDPDLAAKNNVNVAQLQSVGNDFEVGFIYKIEIHNNAGITITPVPLDAGVTNAIKSHQNAKPRPSPTSNTTGSH